MQLIFVEIITFQDLVDCLLLHTIYTISHWFFHQKGAPSVFMTEKSPFPQLKNGDFSYSVIFLHPSQLCMLSFTSSDFSSEKMPVLFPLLLPGRHPGTHAPDPEAQPVQQTEILPLPSGNSSREQGNPGLHAESEHLLYTFQ